MRINPAEITALILTFKIALMSLVVMFPPGLLIGWLLAKRDFPGKSLLNTFVMLPLILPPVISGYVLLMLLSSNGLIGGLLSKYFGWKIVFTPTAVVIAVSVISFPLLVRGIMSGISSVSTALEKAARTLGASPIKVFFTITLPLAARGIIGGAILGFSKSLGEFGATMMVAGHIPGKTQTIALSIYQAVQHGEDATVFRLVLISTIVAFCAIWLTERFTLQHD